MLNTYTLCWTHCLYTNVRFIRVNSVRYSWLSDFAALTCRWCRRSRRGGRFSPVQWPPRPPQTRRTCYSESRGSAGSPACTDNLHSSWRIRPVPGRNRTLMPNTQRHKEMSLRYCMRPVAHSALQQVRQGILCLKKVRGKDHTRWTYMNWEKCECENEWSRVKESPMKASTRWRNTYR